VLALDLGLGRADPRYAADGDVPIPKQIKDLNLWLDASAISLSDGALVGAWPDKGGSSYDLTAAGADRPVYKKPIVNGLPVVRYSGSQIMTSSTVTWGNTGITGFAVMATNGVSGVVYESSPSFSANVGSFTHLCDAGRVVSGHNISGFLSTFNSDVVIPDGQFASASSLHDTTLLTDETTVWRDGVKSGAHAPTNNNTSGTFQPYNMSVGGREAGGLGFSGDIAEIIIYNRALTDVERLRIEAYLKSKYAL
jgi:hypothetical protein